MARTLILVVTALLAIVLGAAPSQAQKAYIPSAGAGTNTVSVIDTTTNTVIGTPIAVGGTAPEGVAVTSDGSKVYIANVSSNTVSVIATASNTVVGSPITVGTQPLGVAVTPDGSKVYVANRGKGTVSVIATATNTVVGTITVGSGPSGVAVTPDGSKVYVANFMTGTVSVIATASNTLFGNPISVGNNPYGVAVTPDGSKVYVTNEGDGTVFVIATASNKVIGNAITVGTGPRGVAVTPDGSKVYVANFNSSDVSVIATATNTMTLSVPVGAGPFAFGAFIGPPTLTVAEAGSGSGQVTSSPANINCSASSHECAAMFPNGTQVTLTASASAGSSFSGWSGGCSGNSTCVLTPTVDTTVTATFNAIPSFMLSVSPAGTGVGTVASSPSGIACGAACSASFQSGTQVTLSATPAIGSTFAGWSGAGCSGTGTCSVTITANTAVAATFTQNTAANLTLVAAVLPLSRSVQVGNTATAFATMIDAGPADAATCTIAPQTGIPASFVFQTTNPATNALTGTANTPANIAAGQAQSFVIALSPTAAFAPTNVAFTFTCANASNPAASITGVNTLNLSGSTTSVPDVVALAASGDPGFVDIPGATGTGVFAVATVNLGIDAAITAAANTGTANLPVILTICQTNPTSGACLAAPAPSVTTDIPPNATPTFGIFVAGSAAVANLPGVNRVFVTFTDSGGTLRGETSVAVRTQ